MFSSTIRQSSAGTDGTRTQDADRDSTATSSILRGIELVSSSVNGPCEAAPRETQEQTGTSMASTEDVSSIAGGNAASAHSTSASDACSQPSTQNPSWVCIEDSRHPISDLRVPNVVIFGETGVGKSSIINLIAGKDLADTSSGAQGSMTESQSYDGILGGIRCRLWDTVGFNEGSEGGVPSGRGENSLKGLIRRLDRIGALNLLVYCVFAGRLKKPHQRSYDMVYSEICQKRVPIVLVITNLENEEGEMERWWNRNAEHILTLGMVFDAHACVTTLSEFEARQLESQKRLRDLFFRSLQDGLIPNIVILGEPGVGKSSVVNLIAGQTSVHASDKVHGCRFHHRSYVVSLNETKCRIWSVTVLKETMGTTPTPLEETNLKEFIQRMAHAGGINLLVCCIRGARLTKALRSNYDTFYSKTCRKKVPIALVVTGLENEKRSMEAWWDKNEQALRDHGMQFDAHACVTTLDLGDKVGKERQLDSQKRLRDLVITYSQRPPWKIGESFMSRLFPILRSLLAAPASPIKEPPRTVFIYDMSPDSGTVTECAPGITTPISTALIGYQRYEFIRVDRRRLLQSSAKRDYTGGLLIFYSSPLPDTRIPPEDVDMIKRFYYIAGGVLCPMVVVLRGCDDDVVARTCWEAVANHHNIQGYATSLGDTDDSPRGETKLMRIVERLWVNPLAEGIRSTQPHKH